MAVASDPQIAQWAYQAGWPIDQIPQVVAVSHGESGGDPTRNQVGGGGRGLLQVDIWQHPQFAGLNLDDPLVNLRTSLGIWKAQGWGAWYGVRSNWPSLDQVKSWIAGIDPNAPANAAAGAVTSALPDLSGGIAGAGQAIGSALVAVPTQIGHGLVLFLLAAGHNLISFAETQAVAVFVALVVVLVIFL